MPIEYDQLKDAPLPLSRCPSCEEVPFATMFRGIVQRRKKKYPPFSAVRPYCAVICAHCGEVVGYEMPGSLIFEPVKGSVYGSRTRQTTASS